MIESKQGRYESSFQVKNPDGPRRCGDDSMSTADSLSLAQEESQGEEAVHECQIVSIAASSECDFNSKSKKRKRLKHNRSLRLYFQELLEASKRIDKQQEIWTSEFAFRVYLVLVVSFLLQRPWIVQGVSLMIIFHILKLFLSWFTFVIDAKEIREFRRLAVWWINFGLDFSSKTIEGDTLHRILTAFSLNFWNSMGKNYALNFFSSIGKEQGERFLLQAKENLNRSQKTYLKLRRILHAQTESK